MIEVTYHVEVVGSYNEGLGYIWHVFRNLEPMEPDTQFIACVEFPNWRKDTFNPLDKGYLTVKYVEQGVDKWFNGKDLIPYNYDNVVFLKFKHEQPMQVVEEIILD